MDEMRTYESEARAPAVTFMVKSPPFSVKLCYRYLLCAVGNRTLSFQANMQREYQGTSWKESTMILPLIFVPHELCVVFLVLLLCLPC